jgi:hypothetical protein
VAIVPRPVEGAFDDVLFDFIAGNDGFATRVYSDRRGIPTLGLGYALLVNTPGWPPRDSLERDLAALGIRLTPADRCRLTAVGEALSRHDLKHAGQLVAPWTPGEESPSKNRFSFRIDREQAKALFHLIRPDYDILLRRKLGGALTDRLANSRELVALFSLAYHNPTLIGPNLSAALSSGARARAWYEIRFGSNRQRHSALQQRRNREAEMFGLVNAVPCPVERRSAADFLKEQHLTIRRYLADVGCSEADIETSLASLSTGARQWSTPVVVMERVAGMTEAGLVPPGLNGDSNGKARARTIVLHDC